MKKINWDITTEDQNKINAICERVLKTINCDKLGLLMDVTTTHLNGCPLDLDGLLISENFDFFHDIVGIARNIDRKTGQLKNCFLPRYAKNS